MFEYERKKRNLPSSPFCEISDVRMNAFQNIIQILLNFDRTQLLASPSVDISKSRMSLQKIFLFRWYIPEGTRKPTIASYNILFYFFGFIHFFIKNEIRKFERTENTNNNDDWCEESRPEWSGSDQRLSITHQRSKFIPNQCLIEQNYGSNISINDVYENIYSEEIEQDIFISIDPDCSKRVPRIRRNVDKDEAMSSFLSSANENIPKKKSPSRKPTISKRKRCINIADRIENSILKQHQFFPYVKREFMDINESRDNTFEIPKIACSIANNVGSCNNGSHLKLNQRNSELYSEKEINLNQKNVSTNSNIFTVSSIESDLSEPNGTLQPTSAYLPYSAYVYGDVDQAITFKHKKYQSERHGTTLNPVTSSEKIPPEARDILIILRENVSQVIDDIIEVEKKMTTRDFTACTLVVEHLSRLPNMLEAFIDHLNYTPQEFELVNVATSITNLIMNVYTDPVTILFRMIELAHELYYLGRVLGENFIPKDLPKIIHSIEVKLQGLKIGRVVRQYFYIPVSYDFMITPYIKDRQLTRLEEDCRCVVNLLHPDDPRCRYCLPGYRTIEVLYDEEKGKFKAFTRRLNIIFGTGRATARLATTILRQLNGQELSVSEEDAVKILQSDRRPRFEDIQALILSLKRPNL